MQKLSRKVALATTFGVVIFVSKTLLPTPFDKMILVVQAMFLALGFLAIGAWGATTVALIGGALTALLRAPFSIFTIAFAAIYGLLVDLLSTVFKVKDEEGVVKTKRLVAATTLSTAVVGLTSYYVTTHILTLLPRNLVLEIAILIAGVVNGLVGGYFADLVWRRGLNRMWDRQMYS